MMKINLLSVSRGAYEIPSAALAEHFWRKYTLAQLKAQAQAIRRAEQESHR